MAKKKEAVPVAEGTKTENVQVTEQPEQAEPEKKDGRAITEKYLADLEAKKKAEAEKVMQENKQEIIQLLKSTGRDRIDILIEELEDDGFFQAPASGGYHSNQLGGLAQHTLNVVDNAEKIAVGLLGTAGYNLIKNSVIIAAVLHDLGKVGDYGKHFYVPNMVQDGRPTKADPIQKYKQSEKKPWKRNSDLTNIPHGIRSAIIANRWFELTEDEEYAICFHDGMYEPSNRAVIPGHETQLLMIIHWADMWASHVQEGTANDIED